eukprot:COSAG02_NODE_14458_length_1269_cov_1.438462_2_plen_114_part_00
MEATTRAVMNTPKFEYSVSTSILGPFTEWFSEKAAIRFDGKKLTSKQATRVLTRTEGIAQIRFPYGSAIALFAQTRRATHSDGQLVGKRDSWIDRQADGHCVHRGGGGGGGVS